MNAMMQHFYVFGETKVHNKNVFIYINFGNMEIVIILITIYVTTNFNLIMHNY